MKKTVKTVIAAVMTAAMLISEASASVLNFTELGDIHKYSSRQIGDGLTYTSASTAKGDRSQNVYVFEYKPNNGIFPVVRYGDRIYGMDQLGSMAKSLENEGDTVFGGVNGDFFSTQTGVPMGVMIDNGELISTDSVHDPVGANAIGFYSDGTAIIGKPAINVHMKYYRYENDEETGERKLTYESSTPRQVTYVNKYPSEWGTYLLTDEYGASTHSTLPSCEILIKLDSELKARGKVTGTVTSIKKHTSNTPIPKGYAVLSVADIYAQYDLYDCFLEGDIVEFEFTCNDGWENVVTAFGGGDIILENGYMPDGIVDEPHEKYRNPRTSIGIRADKSVVVFAVDGRENESIGITLAELAQVMCDLGCVSALNLDGGSSTTVVLKDSGEKSCVYVNAPPASYYSYIGNGILFANSEQPDGEPYALRISPLSPYILKGATVKYNAYAVDRAYTYTGQTFNAGSLKLGKTTSSITDVTEEGSTHFKLHFGRDGIFDVPLSAMYGDSELNGIATVTVKDRITELNTAFTTKAIISGQKIDLGISSKYYTNELYSSPECYTYKLNGSSSIVKKNLGTGYYGYVTENGEFQSYGNTGGKTELTVSYGNVSKTVTVYSETISDIKGHWAEGDIRWLASLGIIEHSDCTDLGKTLEYYPDKKINRGEFAKMLALALHLDTESEKAKAVRIESGTPNMYGRYIKAAIAAGYMTGRLINPDGSYKYDWEGLITREETFKVLGAIVDSEPAELSYADLSSVHQWAYDGLARLVAVGIVKGYTDNTVRPKKNITHAEMSAMFSRSLPED